ncbi:hypothetical protein H0H93_008772 [Arthromyces matolae]|nr:hypothetical protein H0H93_008772 [Arthromyces matolae]
MPYSLQCAVKDADRFRDYLVSGLAVPRRQITNLRNQEATRAAILGALGSLAHNEDICSNDRVFIYFAGIGGAVRPPSATLREIQTLFPYDFNLFSTEGLSTGIFYITLVKIIEDISAQKGGLGFDVILDCSFSDSGIRATTADLAVCGANLPDSMLANALASASWRNSLFIENGSHLTLIAPLGITYENVDHGVFTHALLNILRNADLNQLTYANLMTQMSKDRDVEFCPRFQCECIGFSSWDENVKTFFTVILNNVDHYRHLLLCDKYDAQLILDAFQHRTCQLLDTRKFEPRTVLIDAMIRLSGKMRLFPTNLIANLPEPTTHPEAGGQYADVYKVLYQGRETCWKVIRIFQNSSLEDIFKIPKYFGWLTQLIVKESAREASIWAQLSHPNVLPFYGISRLNRRIAFITHWATNGNLKDYLEGTPEADRVLLCLDMACGLQYLHENNIVHGDLKSMNVLINAYGRACLGDFGLSNVIDPDIIKWTSQPAVSSEGGTLHWQAPEVVETESSDDKKYNTRASDIYALASTFYEAFTGEIPFFETRKRERVRRMIKQGRTPTPPEPTNVAWQPLGSNGSIWSLMMDCWKMQPGERPDITTVLSKLRQAKVHDTRPSGSWEEGPPLGFRDTREARTNLDPLSGGNDLEILLARIIMNGS